MAAPGLVEKIVEAGGLTDARWRAAFEDVPREIFVPSYYRVLPDGTEERIGRDDPDPRRRAEWRDGVRLDVPLATDIRDGVLISSSSQPSLMARMLEALDVRDGMNVLEIGTGTGYNAALLSHRLGDAHVTSVDIDAAITGAARRHLAEAGRRPHVVTGDGALGCPEHAPYDRVLATCSLPYVPEAWVRQCVPGALVLVPVAAGLLALRVHNSRYATGHFLPDPAFFVPLRGDTVGPAPVPHFAGVPWHATESDSFRFLLLLSAGGLTPREAYELWSGEGRPGRERYGVTCRDGRQWAWLDDPQRGPAWPLGQDPDA